MFSFYKKLFPQEIQNDLSIFKKINLFFLIGIFIRCLIMPFCTHIDLFSIYWRSHLMTYHGQICLPVTQQILAHYIHSFFLLLFRPFLPVETQFFLPYHYSETLYSIDGGWMQFINTVNIFRVLFLFKIPYLLFDIGCSILLLYLFDNNKHRFKAFIFWIFNPLIIFGTYIFGRFEVMAIFFILLTLFYAKKNKRYLSLLFLGISIGIRPYGLLFIPIFVLILGTNLKDKLKLVFISLVPVIITSTINNLGKPKYALIDKFLSSEVCSLTQVRFCDYILSMKFNLFFENPIYIFVVFFTFIILHLYINTHRNFYSLEKYCFLVILLFFSTCFFHPQYFLWIFSFMIFFVIEEKKGIYLFLIQVICLFFYTFLWERPLWNYLLTPISPNYFYNLVSPGEIIDKYFPLRKFVGVFSSILSGTCIFQMWVIFKSLKNEKN